MEKCDLFPNIYKTPEPRICWLDPVWVGSLDGHGSNVSFSVKIHFIFIGFSRVSNNYILIPTADERTIQLEHFYLFSPPWSLSN